MKERMNGKMLELTIENKELKKRMGEWTILQQECKELKKKKEAWNEAKHAYQKALININIGMKDWKEKRICDCWNMRPKIRQLKK